MLATYEEALRDKFLARFRADAVVIPSGTTDTVLTWTLRFTEFDHARRGLVRFDPPRPAGGVGAQPGAEEDHGAPPRRGRAGHHNGGLPATERHDVLDLLGLEKPEPT